MSHISWSVPEPQVPAGTHPALADMARAAAEAFGLFVSNGRGELARRSQLFVARAASAGAEVAAVGEADVEAAQVGLQPGVLDGNQVCWCTGFVEVRVPHAWRGDKRAAGLPVHADWVDDLVALVETGAHQCVAARLGVQDQIECHRLVAVRELLPTGGQNPKHRPQHMSDGQRLLFRCVGQQRTDPAFVVGAGARCDLVQLGHPICATELGRGKPRRGR
jgi:hypothetical protein